MHRLHVLIITSVIFCACTPKTVIQYDEMRGDTGEKCSVDTDCRTPATYMVRSVCPFESKCLQNTCAVVCPIFDQEISGGTGFGKRLACKTNADCTCDQYPLPPFKSCECIDNACVAVMER